MYRRVLVAIDASQESTAVLKRGKALAEASSAALVVAHIVEQPYINYAYGELVAQQYLPSVEEIKKQIMPTLLMHMESAEVSADLLRVELGTPVDTITELATEGEFDLLVVGSHGRHGLQLLLGSTANGILHHAKCDVLAVRVFDG